MKTNTKKTINNTDIMSTKTDNENLSTEKGPNFLIIGKQTVGTNE
jgi:hypothetical protein